MPIRSIATIALALSALLTNPAMAQQLPPWARWSTQPVPHKTVREAFEALKESGSEQLLSKDHSFVAFSNWNSGPLQGYWQFSGGDTNTRPNRYFHFVSAPKEQWVLEVSWACDDTPKSCQAFKEAIPSMLPPPPPPAPPPGSSHPREPQWKAIFEEKCSPKPQNRSISYPQHLLGTGISGTTTLILVLNPCGEVRDAVIEKSSHNTDIDLAAVMAAMTWVIDPNDAQLRPGFGGQVRVPIVMAPPPKE